MLINNDIILVVLFTNKWMTWKSVLDANKLGGYQEKVSKS